ncbi:uncharacterized protein HMPREF1541_10884 [Cyphellophora europaea CBS 101466]|uniref:NB-ARC domain-containing protein n=1 Tax=Cyphellophora europaea (strain CBS 101466) TaxID=1220924 RepID=W2S7X4_CYPE1|nr:uncharacterized protein HMPREF1541_10884 [Cyphellophora europaea CBS 101466]ETN44019.1 hypothetical protein HMPREF1541_10884 [Cyphellophora europaea CBS 101466]
MSRALMIVLSTGLLGLLMLLGYVCITRHIPSRRDRRQRPQARWGLVEFRRADLGTQLRADGVDVVFVHGLGANPDTTWTATLPPTKPAIPDEHDKTQERVCWVTNLWIDDIPAEVRRKTRIFFYNHDSGWRRDGVQGRLSTLAGRMLHELRGMPQGSARALVFVAHSYGGLLVKQALVEANTLGVEFELIRQRTKGILFLGTPHRGSNFTTLGTLVASCLRPIGADSSILRELDYDSTYLHDLHTHFVRVVKHERDAFTQVLNVFEQRPTVMVRCGTLQWAQLVVRESSATYTGTQYVQNVSVAVDHSGLNKFAARTDEGYQTLRNMLRDLLPPQLPPIEIRPISRAPMYTERYELSREIEQHLWPLTDGDDDGFRALVIYGVGGVGKTQLTLQYIKEHRHRYNPVLWLDASTMHSLRHSFQVAATALKLSDEPSPTDQEGPLSRSPLVSRVREWLADRDEGDARWLVVVDNADEVGHDLKAIIPRGRRGHVIVTSQTQQSSQLFEVRPARLLVDSMQSSEAYTLLVKRMRVKSRHVSAENGELVDAIAQRMGCLALAVDMAGAVLADEIDRAHGGSPDLIPVETVHKVLQQYLQDFDAHRDDMLRYSQRDELSDYQKTVWTLWDTSFGALQKAGHSRALEYLILMAHLDSGTAHHELFRLASVGWEAMVRRMAINVNNLVPDWLQTMLQVRDGEWDDFHYRRAVKLLERYVLVQQTKEEWPGTTMHRMIQWRAQKAGEEDGGGWRGWVWAAAIPTALGRQHKRDGNGPW